MTSLPPETRRRIAGFAGAAGLQALLGYALFLGLTVDIPARINDSIKLFEIAPEAPPPRLKPVPPRAPKRSGASAPRARKALPTAIVAPPLEIPPPPTLVTAPLPDLGAATRAGAAQSGPGSTSGGTGSGSGVAGDGPGGGGTPARWRRGRITGGDYPQAAYEAGTQGTLWSRYVVGTDGRVKSCTVTRSSGSALLDETTCRLIIERFRYTPARDANGRRTTDVVSEDHHWVLDK